MQYEDARSSRTLSVFFFLHHDPRGCSNPWLGCGIPLGLDPEAWLRGQDVPATDWNNMFQPQKISSARRFHQNQQIIGVHLDAFFD